MRRRRNADEVARSLHDADRDLAKGLTISDHLDERYGVSQRRICRILGRSRSGLRYRRKRRPDEPALNREIKRLARDILGTVPVESMPSWSESVGRSISNG